jgi:hypothetical protein
MATHMQVPEEAPVTAAAIHGEAPVPKPLQPTKPWGGPGAGKAEKVTIASIMGAYREGYSEFDFKHITTALESKHVTTSTLQNVQAHGTKSGNQSDYLKDMPGQLKEMLAYGDPSHGKKFNDHMRPAPREEVSSDVAVSAAIEVSQRDGDAIYGYQIPDMSVVQKDIQSNNGNHISADMLGYSEGQGMFQYGYGREDWEGGPQKIIDQHSALNGIEQVMEDDHVRMTLISNGIRTYDPTAMWTGDGHGVPRPAKPVDIPFSL